MHISCFKQFKAVQNYYENLDFALWQNSSLWGGVGPVLLQQNSFTWLCKWILSYFYPFYMAPFALKMCFKWAIEHFKQTYFACAMACMAISSQMQWILNFSWHIWVLWLWSNLYALSICKPNNGYWTDTRGKQGLLPGKEVIKSRWLCYVVNPTLVGKMFK